MMAKISFRWIITLAMLAVGILPVLMLSFVLIQQAYNTSRTNALRELELLAGDGANRIEQEIRLLRSRLDLLAQDSDMEFAVRSLAFVERADKLVRELQRSNPLVHEIWYLSSLNSMIVSAPIRVEMLAPPRDIATGISDRIKLFQQSLPVTNFNNCTTRDNQPALCLFQPVVGSMGDTIGIIGIQIRFSQIPLVAVPNLSKTIQLRIYSQEKKLLVGPSLTETSLEKYFSFAYPVMLSSAQNGENTARPLLFTFELSEKEQYRLAPVDNLMRKMTLYILAVSVGVIFISLFISRKLFLPIKAMTSLVRSYEQGDFAAQPKAVQFSEFQAFMHTLSSLGKRILLSMRAAANDAARESAMKRAIAEAELQTLKNQMKPHFLFNALNNVVALISFDKERAQKLLVKLSDLYRLILAQTEKVVIPLEDELSIVENFLALQSVRFENRLSYQISCEVNKKEVFIPGLVLQTLVENALKHGIEPCREGGRVEVRVTKADSSAKLPYRVEVTNTGQPLLSTLGNGKGLENTRRRLTLVDGDTHEFSIEATPQGTRVKFFFSGREYDKNSHC